MPVPFERNVPMTRDDERVRVEARRVVRRCLQRRGVERFEGGRNARRRRHVAAFHELAGLVERERQICAAVDERRDVLLPVVGLTGHDEHAHAHQCRCGPQD